MLPLAFLGIDAGELAIMLIFGLPIVAILTGHRRKVIEMKLRMQGPVNNQAANQPQIDQLRSEVKELKELVHQQMISVDSLLTNQAKIIESQRTQDVQSRIGN